ncbi:hypothetical protein FE251_09225 [Georgenia wutianyii]|uniref:DUF222 domain-containing protein n=1 Tax=Georgenia wutianyii TaxID=2585135 RepID=A0ABX5VRU3_9MICO|nr:hypothetical protein [Georgenia wutianyii]QDB79535.1 hypothetical protein FE251_09225 [Georgenia wutianyii]
MTTDLLDAVADDEALTARAFDEITSLGLTTAALIRVRSGTDGLRRFIDGSPEDLAAVPVAMRAPLARGEWLALSARARYALVAAHLAREYAKDPAHLIPAHRDGVTEPGTTQRTSA